MIANTVHEIRPMAATRAGGRACVYLLARRDRARFKLGWTHRPWLRARELPECSQGELDLHASRLIWLPGRQRAQQVERALHRQLAAHRVSPGHRLDGSTEWFDGQAQPAALRLLARTPLQEGCPIPSRLRPLQSPLPGSIVWRTPATAQQAWHWLEELLSRIGLYCETSLSGGESCVLTLQRLRRRREPQLRALRHAVLEAATHPSITGNGVTAVVGGLAWRGDDLAVRFVPNQALRRTTDQHQLNMVVMSFLWRLNREKPMSGVSPLHGAFAVAT